MRGRLVIRRVLRTPLGIETIYGLQTTEGTLNLNSPHLEERYDISVGSEIEVVGEKLHDTFYAYSIRPIKSSAQPRAQATLSFHVL